MPINISKKAQKILAKVDAQAEAARERAGPKPKSTDPETSLQFALQLFSVKGGTLMMVRKKDGFSYLVKSYNPATRTIVLLNEELQFEFETTFRKGTEDLYSPLWR